MLEYRRVLVDWQPVEVTQPGQCLVDTDVASSRPAWRGGNWHRLPWGHVVWQRLPWHGVPERRDAVTMALHQVPLLSPARISRVRWFCEERYRPEPTGRVTRRAGGTPDPPLRGAKLQNGPCLGS
jgi:hypothetical protein